MHLKPRIYGRQILGPYMPFPTRGNAERSLRTTAKRARASGGGVAGTGLGLRWIVAGGLNPRCHYNQREQESHLLLAWLSRLPNHQNLFCSTSLRYQPSKSV